MIQIILLPDHPDSAHCAYSDWVSRHQGHNNCIYSPWIKDVDTLMLCHLGFLWKHHRFLNGCSALLWFALPYLWMSAVSWCILNSASQSLTFQCSEIKLREQENVATASLTATSTPCMVLPSAVPLPERLWQMELLLGPGLLPGGLLCTSVVSMSKPVTAWMAFPPGKLLGVLLGSQPRLVQADLLTHPGRKWTSVWHNK